MQGIICLENETSFEIDKPIIIDYWEYYKIGWIRSIEDENISIIHNKLLGKEYEHIHNKSKAQKLSVLVSEKSLISNMLSTTTLALQEKDWDYVIKNNLINRPVEFTFERDGESIKNAQILYGTNEERLRFIEFMNRLEYKHATIRYIVKQFYRQYEK